MNGKTDKQKPREKIIVVRYPAMAELYIRAGLCDKDTRVVGFANPDDLRDKDAYGVLPLHLACHANSITEIPIVAGKNVGSLMHDPDLLEAYARQPIRYTVSHEKLAIQVKSKVSPDKYHEANLMLEESHEIGRRNTLTLKTKKPQPRMSPSEINNKIREGEFYRNPNDDIDGNRY